MIQTIQQRSPQRFHNILFELPEEHSQVLMTAAALPQAPSWRQWFKCKLCTDRGQTMTVEWKMTPSCLLISSSALQFSSPLSMDLLSVLENFVFQHSQAFSEEIIRSLPYELISNMLRIFMANRVRCSEVKLAVKGVMSKEKLATSNPTCERGGDARRRY